MTLNTSWEYVYSFLQLWNFTTENSGRLSRNLDFYFSSQWCFGMIFSIWALNPSTDLRLYSNSDKDAGKGSGNGKGGHDGPDPCSHPV